MEYLNPNVCFSVRILFIMSVATGDRSFSKLKLIEAYLWLFVSQGKLSSFATFGLKISSLKTSIARNW
jgi:hypothetical protein